MATTEVNTVGYQILALSSGTLASITGLRKYSEIEDFQNRFFQWTVIHNPQYTKWQDAINAFIKAGGK